MWRVTGFEVRSGLQPGCGLALETEILGGPVRLAVSVPGREEATIVWASESFPDPFEHARIRDEALHELSHLAGATSHP